MLQNNQKADEQTPQKENKFDKATKMCVLSWVLFSAGVLCAVGGFYLADDLWRYHEQTAVTCIAIGILLGLFNTALAVIVDACQKYRDRH